MIVTVTLNPAIDQTIEVDRFVEGDTNPVTSIRLELGGKGITIARGLKELGRRAAVISARGAFLAGLLFGPRAAAPR